MAKKFLEKSAKVKGGDMKSVPPKGQKQQENNDDEDEEDFDGSDDGYDDDEFNQDEEDSDNDEEDEEDEDSNEEEDDDEFEVQSGESSNSDEEDDEDSDDDDDDEEDINDENAAEQKAITRKAEASIRYFREANVIKNVIKATKAAGKAAKSSGNNSRSNSSSNTSVTTTAPTDLTSLLNTDDISSDEEDRVDQDHINTIGRVPLHWYDAYDHIGYTINGQKLFKKGIAGNNNVIGDGSGETRDRIDQAIKNRDNPNSLNTVYDMYNDREVVLSARDLEIISRLQAGR